MNSTVTAIHSLLLDNDLIISQLIERVGETHAPNSARYYRVMLRRLQQFNDGHDRIPAHRLNARFVQDFSDFLTRSGLTQSTVRQMLKFFRGLLKPLVPAHRRRDLRALFDTLQTKRPAWSNNVNIADTQRIIDAKNLPLPLEKIRMLFIYRVLCIGDITSEPDGGLQRHIQWIDNQFRMRFSESIATFSDRIPDPDYRQGLVTLLAHLSIPWPVNEFYEENTWIAIARRLGIETDIIVSVLPDYHPLAASLQHRLTPPTAELRAAGRQIADFMVDLRERWYAMRCLKESPDEVNTRLINDLPLGEDEMFQVFIVPRESAKVRKAIGANPIEKMLFFRTYPAMAKQVKSDFYKYAYVYTKGRSGEPLPIADAEMRTFLLLCRLAPETLRSFYPEETPETAFQPGAEATVTDGEMFGQVGVVQRLSSDSYTVRMTFQGLGNITVTADIPLRFLRLNPTD